MEGTFREQAPETPNADVGMVEWAQPVREGGKVVLAYRGNGEQQSLVTGESVVERGRSIGRRIPATTGRSAAATSKGGQRT